MALSDRSVHYDSAETRDCLNERGNRYKRNTIALSSGAMAAAWLPGISLDLDKLSIITVVDPTWLWIATSAVIVFNAIFLAFHAWQDLTLMQRDFHAIHLGHPTVFITGRPHYEYDHKGEISAGYVRNTTDSGDFQIGYRSAASDLRSDEPHFIGYEAKGLLVSRQDYYHLRRKRRFFFGAEVVLPAIFFVGGLAAIACEVNSLDGSRNEARSYSIMEIMGVHRSSSAPT